MTTLDLYMDKRDFGNNTNMHEIILSADHSDVKMPISTKEEAAGAEELARLFGASCRCDHGFSGDVATSQKSIGASRRTGADVVSHNWADNATNWILALIAFLLFLILITK